MNQYDDSYPHPHSPWGKAWRERAADAGQDDPYEGLFMIVAEGQPWIDAEGRDTFERGEALALAEDLETVRGYFPVEIVPA